MRRNAVAEGCEEVNLAEPREWWVNTRFVVGLKMSSKGKRLRFANRGWKDKGNARVQQEVCWRDESLPGSKEGCLLQEPAAGSFLAVAREGI